MKKMGKGLHPFTFQLNLSRVDTQSNQHSLNTP